MHQGDSNATSDPWGIHQVALPPKVTPLCLLPSPTPLFARRPENPESSHISVNSFSQWTQRTNQKRQNSISQHNTCS